MTRPVGADVLRSYASAEQVERDLSILRRTLRKAAEETWAEMAGRTLRPVPRVVRCPRCCRLSYRWELDEGCCPGCGAAA